jgi:ACT domain-containing protein
MSNTNQTITMITYFRLSAMTLKILSKFTGNDIHDQASHGPVFQELQQKLTPITLTMIQEVDKIIDALGSISAVESVEITNPSNGNGFIVHFDRSL